MCSRHTAPGEFCALAGSDWRVHEIFSLAETGAPECCQEICAMRTELVKEAHDKLAGCIRLRCVQHGRGQDALRVLDTLLFDLECEEAVNE